MGERHEGQITTRRAALFMCSLQHGITFLSIGEIGHFVLGRGDAVDCALKVGRFMIA